MKILRTETVKLSDLQENLFVRQTLNHDHVLALAELIEGGIAMKDPIEILEDRTIVDGRHRKQGYELNDWTEVVCRVLHFNSDAEMIAYAYKQNTGGSLPPSRTDTEHTVRLLLDRKMAKKNIGSALGLPPEVAVKYVNIVQSKIARQKLQQAASAVIDGGLTTPKAAELHDVDVDQLRQMLSGSKKKSKKGLPQKQQQLSTAYRALASTQGKIMKWLLEQIDEGDVLATQAHDFIESVGKTQSRLAKSLDNWKQRLDGKVNGTAEDDAA